MYFFLYFPVFGFTDGKTLSADIHSNLTTAIKVFEKITLLVTQFNSKVTLFTHLYYI